jgi:hypothetical protein
MAGTLARPVVIIAAARNAVILCMNTSKYDFMHVLSWDATHGGEFPAEVFLEEI